MLKVRSLFFNKEKAPSKLTRQSSLIALFEPA